MKKDKAIVTRFDLETIVEFAVAAEVLGARTTNSLIHQLVKQKIREAKELISTEEFLKLTEAQKIKTLERSEMTKKRREKN